MWDTEKWGAIVALKNDLLGHYIEKSRCHFNIVGWNGDTISEKKTEIMKNVFDLYNKDVNLGCRKIVLHYIWFFYELMILLNITWIIV